jgi:hypothetical protein
MSRYGSKNRKAVFMVGANRRRKLSGLNMKIHNKDGWLSVDMRIEGEALDNIIQNAVGTAYSQILTFGDRLVEALKMIAPEERPATDTTKIKEHIYLVRNPQTLKLTVTAETDYAAAISEGWVHNGSGKFISAPYPKWFINAVRSYWFQYDVLSETVRAVQGKG